MNRIKVEDEGDITDGGRPIHGGVKAESSCIDVVIKEEENDPDDCEPVIYDSFFEQLEETYNQSDEVAGPSEYRTESVWNSHTSCASLPKKKSTRCGVELFTCYHCNYQCRAKSLMIPHMRTHTEEKPKLCDSVNKLRTPRIWKKRVRKPPGTTTQRFDCPYCDYSCTKNLKQHTITFHNEEKPYLCTDCDYKSDIAKLMVDHRRIHTGEMPYACGECDYRGRTRSRLTMHKKTHTRPYKCDECGYTCSRGSHLTIHKRTHIGEKRFECEFCEYRSIEAHSMKRHMRSHTGEKPYACAFCDYRSVDIGTLKAHVRRHTGEKPYKCNKCGRSFTQHSNLRMHLKNIHGKQLKRN